MNVQMSSLVRAWEVCSPKESGHFQAEIVMSYLPLHATFMLQKCSIRESFRPGQTSTWVCIQRSRSLRRKA